MRERSKVMWFNPEKGFGFIKRMGMPDVFVHVSSLQGIETLEANQWVEFEVIQTRKGLQAVNVTPV
jgi:CspA family cold shock protein